MAPSRGCALQEAMEEEEEKKPFDGYQQNKRHHHHREVWGALRRVARLRPVGETWG